jgi:hypothetical protein
MSDTTTTFADCLRELGVAGQVAEFDTDVPTAAAAAEQLAANSARSRTAWSSLSTTRRC